MMVIITDDTNLKHEPVWTRHVSVKGNYKVKILS